MDEAVEKSFGPLQARFDNGRISNLDALNMEKREL
jgi:hypothetical protein